MKPGIMQALLVVAAVLLIGYAPALGVPVTLLWLLPIFCAIKLGISRDRMGWLWGLLLGWIGVLILAIMRPQPR
jgi:hypothetical protein